MDHTGEIGLRLCKRYPRLKARDGAILKIVSLVLFFFRREAHRHPEIAMAEASGLERKFKIARHDADDGVGAAVDVDGVAKNGGIGVEALVPERVADESRQAPSCHLRSA